MYAVRVRSEFACWYVTEEFLRRVQEINERFPNQRTEWQTNCENNNWTVRGKN